MLEVILYAEVPCRAERSSHQAAGDADERSQREQEHQANDDSPEPPAKRSPGDGVVSRRRYVHLALGVAADDRRILQVDQVILLELD